MTLFTPPVFLAFPITADGAASQYWAVASFLTGVYLWCVSGLGYTGAKAYRANPRQGVVSLLGFTVMIVAFLSMFVAAVSVVAQQGAWVGVPLNLLATGALFVFGVGSYLIEIVYLATERN